MLRIIVPSKNIVVTTTTTTTTTICKNIKGIQTKFGYILEFNGGGLTVQNNFAHTTNQNFLNCHI
jgi:hypothetical protein